MKTSLKCLKCKGSSCNFNSCSCRMPRSARRDQRGHGDASKAQLQHNTLHSGSERLRLYGCGCSYAVRCVTAPGLRRARRVACCKQATGGARSTSSTSLNASSLGGGAGNKPECVKLLDSKRSQALGILISSKRLDAHIVRDALLNFDKYLLS